MKLLIYFLAIFFLLVIQQGVLAPLRILPVNLLLLFAVTAMVVADFNTALWISLACGVVLDLASGTADGLIILTLFSTFLMVYFMLHAWVNREPNQLVLFSSVASATVLYYLLFLLFARIFGIFHLAPAIDFNYFFTTELPLSLAFNLIFTYPVFLYFSYVQSLWSGKPEQV